MLQLQICCCNSILCVQTWNFDFKLNILSTSVPWNVKRFYLKYLLDISNPCRGIKCCYYMNKLFKIHRDFFKQNCHHLLLDQRSNSINKTLKVRCPIIKTELIISFAYQMTLHNLFWNIFNSLYEVSAGIFVIYDSRTFQPKYPYFMCMKWKWV